MGFRVIRFQPQTAPKTRLGFNVFGKTQEGNTQMVTKIRRIGHQLECFAVDDLSFREPRGATKVIAEVVQSIQIIRLEPYRLLKTRQSFVLLIFLVQSNG